MGGGKGGQTIGYHYLFDILFGISRGPINELVEIVVGEKSAWKGSLSDDTIHSINEPNLFGGEKKEGGIQGPFRIFPGRFDQVLPGEESISVGGGKPYNGTRTLPNVKTAIGGLVSEFRGTTMLWFSGLISSMNPYPKEWKFRIRRSDAGWYNDEPWYPEMARIKMGANNEIHAMNPAHMIYQCLNDPQWGRGLPVSLIDLNSFILAANTLCTEGFGLCLFWQRKDDIDTFVGTIREHIAAELYLDPETGRMTLKLLRNDYVADDLPLFTPETGLLEITDDDASSQDMAFNEIVGKGHDPVTNQDFQKRVHNLAARQSQESANPQTVEYPGIPTPDMLVRVLQRDLKLHASGLKRLVVSLDRRGWRIRPGMCFRISDPKRNIANMVLRAVEITDNAFEKGRIEIKSMEDVYGMPSSSFVTPEEPTWTPPSTKPIPATAAILLEANYRDLRIRADPSVIDEASGSGIIATVALSPSGLMTEYDLATKAEGETDFVVRATGPFTGAATLVSDIGPYDTTFAITGETDWTEDIVGQAVICGTEQMGVTAYDPDTHSLTVERGVADTIPVAHAAAASLWTIDDDAVSDLREYMPGETAEAKVLTRAASGVLPDAPAMSIDVVGRWEMPYPPADVRVDGDPALTLDPGTVYAEPSISWVDRDRLLQDNQLVGHTEAGVGPEAGTTYTTRVYTVGSGVPIRTDAAATSPWQYDATMQAADGSPQAVEIELESNRDGLASFQHYRFPITLSALTPLAVLDFENATYEIGGVSKTLAECVEDSQTYFGDPFDPGDIAAGVGYQAVSTGVAEENSFDFTTELKDAINQGDYDAGFTAIIDLDFSPADGGSEVQAWLGVYDFDNGPYREAFMDWFADNPQTNSIYDSGSNYDDFLPDSGGPHRFGVVLASSGLLMSRDGETAISAGPPVATIADTFTVAGVKCGVFPGPGGGSVTIKKITFYPPMNAADLEAAATP